MHAAGLPVLPNGAAKSAASNPQRQLRCNRRNCGALDGDSKRGRSRCAALASGTVDTGNRSPENLFPFLHLDVANLPVIPSRGGRLRVFASAQHPIALGSAMAMLVPFAVYRAHCYRQRMVGGRVAARARRSRHRLSDSHRRHVRGAPRVRLAAAGPGPALLARADPGAARDPLRRPRDPRGDEGGLLPQGRARRAADRRAGGQRSSRDVLAGDPYEFDPNQLVGEGYGTRVTTVNPGGPTQRADPRRRVARDPRSDRPVGSLRARMGLRALDPAPRAGRAGGQPPRVVPRRRDCEPGGLVSRRCSSTTPSRSSR